MSYTYTLLKQDGTTEVLQASGDKWEYPQLREVIKNLIELIPPAYYPKGMKGTVFGDEEGRFNSDNHRNPHMLVLYDNAGNAWDCVGDLLLEQTELQHSKWQASKISK